MAENFGVLLEAKLDEIKSGKTIEAQLKSMGQKIDSLPIGFDIDIPSVTKQFNGLVKVLESHIGQAGDALNEVFSTTRILKYKDTLGSTVKDYQKLNQETSEFETQNRTITEDAEKQKNILEEQSKIYQKIKSTLDSLPEQFKGATSTQDLYSMLDTSNNLDDLKTLRDLTDGYYKEIIALEKQYQSAKKSTNKDTIEAFKQEESKVNFIYQKRKQLLDLERQINTLSTTKGVNTGNYTPEIENLRNVLGGLSTTGESLYDNQRSEINQIIDSLKQKLSLEKDSLNIQKLQEESQIKINNARQNLNDIITKNGKYDESQYQKLNSDLNILEGNLKSGAISTQDFNLQMKKLNPEMKQFETEARKASASTSTLSSRFKRFLSFYSFYDVLQLGKRLIREVATEVKELDDSLLEVNKIINLSASEMENFVDKAYAMGDAVSRTGREMIDASAVMIKAGFKDLDEAMAFGSLALSMKNVGDNMDNVERNANVLISTMKGFGNETVGFAEKTLNVLNEVSNTSAITFESLAESFTRTSAVYSQAGVSIEQLAGLATGANEIIQNIEKSSSGLLIISQRLRQVTAGFEEDPENLSKLDGALKRIANVDIQDTTGQLRDTYSILTDIAKVYPTLTKNEQAYLSELISGKRQKAIFEALMANWAKVEQATESANNSAGSYLKEQEAYFNSISGHLAKLESAWQSLATNSLDADFTKKLIDLVTVIVKLTDASGGLQTVILGLISSFIAFKVVMKVETLRKMITGFKLLKLAVVDTTTAVTTLTLAGKLLIGSAVIVGIMAIGYAINGIAQKSEKAKEAVKTLSDELKTLQGNSSTVRELSNQFDSLQKLRKEQGLTNEQLQKFVDIQNQLKELLPDVNGFYDEQGNFIIDEKENLDSLNETYKEYIKLKREELALASKESARYTVNNYQNEATRVELLKQYLEYAKKESVGLLQSSDMQQVTFLQDYLGVNFDKTEIEKALSVSRTEIADYIIEMQSDVRNQVMNSEEWNKLGKETKNAILKAFSEVADSQLPKFSEQITTGEMSVKEFLHTMENTQVFKDYMKAVKDSTGVTEEFEGVIISLESQLEGLSGIRSKIEKLQNILDNITLGNISASDMEELLGISEEFIPYLNDELELRNKLNDSINQYKKDYEDGYKSILTTSDNFYKEKIKGDEKLYNALRNETAEFFNDLGIDYTDDFENYKNLEDAKVKLTTKILSELAGKWANYFDAFTGQLKDTVDPRTGYGGTGGIFGSDKNFTSSYNKIKSAQNELDKIFNQVYEPIGFKFETNESSATSTLKSDIKTYTDTLIEEFNKANKEIERNLTQLDLQQQLIGDNSQEYIDIEKKKYDEIIRLETLLQEKISLLQAEGTEDAIEEAERLIDTYYDTVSQRYSIIANLQSSQISLFESQTADLEKQKSAMEDLHEFTMQMIEDELNAKKKSIQEEIKGIEEVFNKRKQALRDEKDARSYEKGLTEKSSLVADLENQLAIIKNDETAIAKRKQLEQELAKAKEDLANYQYDHSIDLAEKALDEELEIQKSKLEEEISELDDTLSNEVTMRELANKRIEKSGEKLKNQLIAHAKEYGTFTIEEVTNAWEIAGSAVDDFDTKQQKLLETLKQITEELAKVEGMNVGEYGSSKGLSTSTKLSASETKAKMMANSAKWIQSDAKTRGDLERDNQNLGNSMGWTYDPILGRWFYDKDKKLPVYHDGGIVGGSGYATKSTEELAKLLKGELVITPPQADKVMDMITNNSNSNITISMPIVIEGNADSDTVKSLEKQVGKIADTVIEKLTTARNNTGFKKKPKFV